MTEYVEWDYRGAQVRPRFCAPDRRRAGRALDRGDHRIRGRDSRRPRRSAGPVCGVVSRGGHRVTHDPIASQGPAGSGVVARLREVEQTESGRLYATRGGYGLAYQSRDVRYNPGAAGEAFTVDYADLDTLGVQTSDDDQKLCNQVTAARPGGATQTVTAPSSVLVCRSPPRRAWPIWGRRA
ncbi:hypothetical protein [Streptomyces sp. BE133]|uniref:hypothetical protein n=1 Tax=Streptomyces sp. BE133 TaxID=3002523 RepID=UPI002E7A284E|nr:hypothetical protein [Streptomyces sp. BE133]MEE1808052.1 hypothetical protein [Streptomyces sp. BE133]